MSGRFVRSSKYRHVFAEVAKPEKQFLNTQVATTGDGNYIASNGKFIVYAHGTRGGGGPVRVLRVDAPARLPSRMPTLSVHKHKVLDFEFSPFDDNLLATCGEDNLVKLTRIPDAGLTEDIKDADVTLSGNEKKVTGLQFHPTANGIIATAGFDQKVRVFDFSSQSCALTFTGHTDAVNHIRWNRDGSQIATTCKDKMIRIFDPRDEKSVLEVKGFDGSKKASCEWLQHNMLAATGFNRGSTRQIKLFDVRNMDRAIHSEDLDQSAGVLIPYYDYDSSILYVGGKGDSSIKYFEITNDSSHMYYLSAFADTKSQKGFCFAPKLSVKTNVCEIGSAFRVMSDAIVPLSFRVPRKAADQFQSDLFPDTYGQVSTQTSDEYLAGGNSEVTLVSMDPENRSDRVAQEVAVKKTYQELETELAAALARIAELEAQQ